jgi:hypothetical protein
VVDPDTGFTTLAVDHHSNTINYGFAVEYSNLGGLRPFGWALGETSGPGRARSLVPDLAEQQTILDIVAMRDAGMTLMAIRDTLRGQGFAISHQSVQNILTRHAAAGAAA